MIVLSPIGWLYGLLMQVRNRLYDRGFLKSYSLGARTISVGNVTTGGTGKTPSVALIAEILADAGEKVCILTRGYGRQNEGKRVLVSDGNTVLADAETGGDEPVELADRLLGKAIVIADADRVSAAKWAKDNFDITVFILDDAFQHRRANRDLDIVCVDGGESLDDEMVLPAGRLREPLTGVSRADVIVLTGTGGPDAERVRNKRTFAPEAAMFQVESELSLIVRLDNGEVHPSSSMSNVFAFCGIAKPRRFIDMLKKKGISVAGFKSFRDHHRYSQIDIDRIVTEAKAAGASGLVTTAKDAVKLREFEFALPCYVAEIGLRVKDPEAFRQLILGPLAAPSDLPSRTP